MLRLRISSIRYNFSYVVVFFEYKTYFTIYNCTYLLKTSLRIGFLPTFIQDFAFFLYYTSSFYFLSIVCYMLAFVLSKCSLPEHSSTFTPLKLTLLVLAFTLPPLTSMPLVGLAVSCFVRWFIWLYKCVFVPTKSISHLKMHNAKQSNHSYNYIYNLS